MWVPEGGGSIGLPPEWLVRPPVEFPQKGLYYSSREKQTMGTTLAMLRKLSAKTFKKFMIIFPRDVRNPRPRLTKSTLISFSILTTLIFDHLFTVTSVHHRR